VPTPLPDTGYRPTQPTDQPFTVPPGTAQATAKEPTQLDQIAEDAAAADEIPEWPEGAPELRPLMSLPFLQRAEAMEAFAEIEKLSRDLNLKKGDEVDLGQAAVMYRALARVDEFLTTVAEQPEAYLAWEGRHNDQLFGQLWAAYQARMQPGEAGRSSS
jgi:hypothetical protein